MPKKEPWDWLFTDVVAEALNPKIPLPVLPTAAEELPKEVLPILPNPATSPLLVSTGSEPDDTGKLVDGKGVDPNLKIEFVADEDAAIGAEELLLLDAITAGVLVVMPVLVEVAVALMLARVEPPNIL